MLKRVPGLILLAMLSACGGGGEEGLSGPCIAESNEPSIMIDAVRNSSSGAIVPTFVLSGIAVDGMPLLAGLSPERLLIAVNARVVGTTVECGTPCGFSRFEGTHTFTVSATGYVSKAVSVSGRYALTVGGCPSVQSGGAHTALTLDPA
ncbi:MAG: hypothetical protein K8R60_03210 [Burkholderiales bacterium]|nr:hypothetical protein [Burkholderiales bacterium]